MSHQEFVHVGNVDVSHKSVFNNLSTSYKAPIIKKQPAQYIFLRVDGWQSAYQSVNNVLLHLMRRTKSESSKGLYLYHIYKFCIYSNKNPDELIVLRKVQVETLVQGFADSVLDVSPRYSNLVVAILKTFFKLNGFKHAKQLELETYKAPKRERKTPEYIPTKSEVYKMADSAGSLRDRAIILTIFSTGLRNSTLRALCYYDIAEELRKGCINIKIPVYPEMKERDPNACKDRTPYYTFTSDDSTEALSLYIKERENRYGNIENAEPLFSSEYNQIPRNKRNRKLISARELQIIVKQAAKRAGINQWKSVHPHCLRKAYKTVLHTPTIDGGNLDINIQDFFMGHVLPGSRDPYFDSSDTEYLRAQYQRLKFGRVIIENRFKILIAAVTKAFEGTDINPEQAIKEYVKLKEISK